MFIREKEVNFKDYKIGFLFAFSFAVILPFLVQSSLFISIIFNIVYLPITIIHELGHFIVALLFFADHNPQLKILAFEDGLKCGCVTIGSLEICWETIFLLLSGSLLVIIVVISVVAFMQRKNLKRSSCIKKYLIFGLLCDIPNLFPTYPIEGIVTDGFRIWVYLHDLMNLPYPTPQFSLLFTVIASVVVFYSSFYLGSFVYETLLTFADKLHKQPVHPTTTAILN